MGQETVSHCYNETLSVGRQFLGRVRFSTEGTLFWLEAAGRFYTKSSAAVMSTATPVSGSTVCGEISGIFGHNRPHGPKSMSREMSDFGQLPSLLPHRGAARCRLPRTGWDICAWQGGSETGSYSLDPMQAYGGPGYALPVSIPAR